MTFLLDANVLFDFQNSGALPALVDAAQTLDMAVAEGVYEEATLVRGDDSPDAVGKKRQAQAALKGARIARYDILPGTPEEALMQALLALRTVKKKDQGEAASVALAVSNPSLVFVTGDTTAVLWALNELYSITRASGSCACRSSCGCYSSGACSLRAS